MLHLVDMVVLDKTGTITEGKPKVTDVITQLEENDFLAIAGSLEKNSEHPLSKAIMETIKEKNITLQEVQEFESVSGRGVKAKIGNMKYISGNRAFLLENQISLAQQEKLSDKLLEEGKTVLYFANENNIIGIIAVSDTIKSSSKEAIAKLKNSNIEVMMVTGDNRKVAEQIAKQVGIKSIISEVLPEEKEKKVANLQKTGKKVAFVGDGINDSPALTRADVGIAIGSGTDIAVESADIILIKNDLLDVVAAINLSKAVIRNIKMNLFWAFFYNMLGIPIACGIFYTSFGLKLSPMLGAAAMSLSSVCVVTNALRLKRIKLRKKEEVTQKMSEKTKKIIIEGMHCNHCKMTVEKALGSLGGVTNVDVNLEQKEATITINSEVEEGKIKEVIEEEGFEVKEIC